MLRGKLADDARAALGDLSRSFLRRRMATDPTLGGGEAGVALAHAALERAFPGEGHAAKAQKCLARAARGLATIPMGPALDHGFVGVAWAVEHLAGDPSLPPDEDANAGIDDALIELLSGERESLGGAARRRTRWTRAYDLLGGLVGIGVYALERLPRASAERMLALVVDRLEETAESRPEGIAWRSRAAWLGLDPRAPYHRWDLGLAHGVPGVIAFLGRVCGTNVRAPAARRLLEGAVDWLVAQELPQGAVACFPGVLPLPRDARPARLAWCYGDAGVAAALLVAAQGAREPAWERHATRIALRAAARDPEGAGAVDAAFCHGAAGLAHLFHRMHRTTGEAVLGRAARDWLARTLAMRNRGAGFGGFARALFDEDGHLGKSGNVGLILGAAGVALALTAAVVPGEKAAWDRALLVSGNGARRAKRARRTG